MKAAIYCRVSTSRQAGEDKVSLGDQEERCRAVCSSKGWEVVEVYDEGDASAGSVNRGEFQRMIADAKAGMFDVIVAREVSRLSRVAQARRAVEELMVEWGISVCNARSGMIYSESEGLGASVIWTLEARLAEAELAEKSFRTTMGKNGKASRGEYPSGRAPYGYKWSGGEHSRVVVDEEQAAVVVSIFEQAAAGISCPEIARRLTAGNVPTSAGAASWASSSVHHLIRNVAYLGDHSYGRTYTKKLLSERDRQAWAQEYFQRTGKHPSRIPSKVVLSRGDGDAHRFDVSIPAIVSRELFDAANQKVERTKRNLPATERRVMLLQGLLRCEGCGQPMGVQWAINGRTQQRYCFYRCNSHRKQADREPCRVRGSKAPVYVAADEIEGYVWQQIDGMLSNPVTLTAALGANAEEHADDSTAQESRIDRHRQRVAKLRRALDASRRAFFAGDVDESTYNADRAHFLAELEMVEGELARMESAAESRRQQEASLEAIARIVANWGEIRDELTIEERREMTWSLVTDVTISPDDHVMVTGKLSWPEDLYEGKEWLPDSSLGTNASFVLEGALP